MRYLHQRPPFWHELVGTLPYIFKINASECVRLHKRYEEVEEWARDLGFHWYWDQHNVSQFCLRFRSEKDALMFKMAWLSA